MKKHALAWFALGFVVSGLLSLWSRDAVIDAQLATIKKQQDVIEQQQISVQMAGQLLDTVFPGFAGRPLPTCVVEQKPHRARRR